MFYALDRFEGDIAVFEELEDGGAVNVSVNELSENAAEGDIYEERNGIWIYDEGKTAERKRKIQDKLNQLLNN